jgi:hypothetical protein
VPCYGARTLMAQAVGADVAEFLAKHASVKKEDAAQQGVHRRNAPSDHPGIFLPTLQLLEGYDWCLQMLHEAKLPPRSGSQARPYCRIPANIPGKCALSNGYTFGERLPLFPPSFRHAHMQYGQKSQQVSPEAFVETTTKPVQSRAELSETVTIIQIATVRCRRDQN